MTHNEVDGGSVIWNEKGKWNDLHTKVEAIVAVLGGGPPSGTSKMKGGAVRSVFGDLAEAQRDNWEP